jgi:LuxR family transcriptional regulator, maltose regulon positive regulatory protein
MDGDDVATDRRASATRAAPQGRAVSRLAGGVPALTGASAQTGRPRAGRATVRRQRLFDMLDAAARHQVTLICAGAGWGKSTLVSDWVDAQRRPVAWLTLDSFDNDPQAFWTHLLAALRSAEAIPSDNPLHDLTSVPEAEGERMRTLARGLSLLRESTVLVLDDLDEIADRRLLRQLTAVLQRPLDALRVVLISRVEPPLSLHRFRASGELGELRERALAFTADETTQLLAGHGLHLPDDELSTLLQRTEGWAMALQLAMAFLADPDSSHSIADFTGDLRHVHDYLTDEVLGRQPPQMRRFLLYTSICENVSGELADAITRGTAGQQTLEALERANHFVVRLGSKPLWFRYHHLVRDVLRHRLQIESPKVLPHLHQRAAGWYADHDCIIKALGHAAAAQDWSYLGRLTAQAAPLIVSTHRTALTRILERVPTEALSSTAELMVSAALLLFQAGDYDGIPARLAGARDLLADRPEADRLPLDITIGALQVSVNRAKGDMPALIADATQLLSMLARARSAAASQALQYRAIALNNKGVGILWSGRAEVAERYLWIASTAARTSGVELVEINAVGHLALLEVMFGSVREAARLAAEIRELAEHRGWQHALQTVPAYLAAALVSLERADTGQARRAVRRALHAHRGDPEAAQWKLWLGAQARLALTQGDSATARALLDEARLERHPRLVAPVLDRWLLLADSEADLMSDQAERVVQRYADRAREEDLTFAERVVLARAAFAQRDMRRAEALLTPLGSIMAETVATVEARILGALIADARGQGIRSADLLTDAIAMAAEEELRQPFLRLGGGQLDALMDRQRMLTKENVGFIADVTQLMRVARQRPRSYNRGELSERETEVLRYLPTMLTAGEIAGEMNVSINTVKAHMRSIYRKLGAARRREAVVRAGERGLL